MRTHYTIWRRVGYGLIGLGVALLFTLVGGQVATEWRWAPAVSMAREMPNSTVQQHLDEGQDKFLRGRLSEAVESLESGFNAAQAQNDELGTAMVLSNLARVYGQMGQWGKANTTIAESLQLIEQPLHTEASWQQVKAQTLNIEGRLQLAQGDAEAALKTWQQTEAAYQLAGDRAGAIRSQLRQARALQALGFYRRAVTEILQPLGHELATEPSSAIKARSFRNLAEALTVAESLKEARTVALEGLEVATALDLPEAIAAAQLTLGNIEYAQAREYDNQNNSKDLPGTIDAAQQWYGQVTTTAEGSHNALRAQLNQLALLIDFEQFDTAAQLWAPAYAQMSSLAPDREGIYIRINLAASLERLAAQSVAGGPTWRRVIALLETAAQQALDSQDSRAEAYILGYLGAAYESQGNQAKDIAQLKTAATLTEQALFTAEAVNAVDISYLWYEQFGDLQVELGQLEGDKGHKQAAIKAYRGAVDTLKSLRSDLVTINPEVQFSFQKSIEPLHRKLVKLLLEDEANPSQANLRDARAVLESLQLEELNNYLRAACINSQEVSVDQISGDQRIAVIYPIVLSDRLGVIANLPTDKSSASKAADKDEGTLKYYSSALEPNELETYTNRMLRQLIFVDYDVLDTAEHLYNLLFPQQLLDDLAGSLPDTLVMIPDGVLRSIPIAALFDGESYLVEKYSLAITPGLQLLNPRPLQQTDLTALTFGLSEAVAEWSPLPNVEEEIQAIGQQLPVEPYLNEQFTYEQFEQVLTTSSVPIVHLATHGQFSSNLEDTFIQAWDRRISVNDLSRWLRGDRTEPVELLVLSACETATGDQRAA
ncbi:MAG: CHAT domain-containing protein, partial [Cyanobacteria bacterium P01_H01_bin.58]